MDIIPRECKAQTELYFVEKNRDNSRRFSAALTEFQNSSHRDSKICAHPHTWQLLGCTVDVLNSIVHSESSRRWPENKLGKICVFFSIFGNPFFFSTSSAVNHIKHVFQVPFQCVFNLSFPLFAPSYVTSATFGDSAAKY